MTDKTQKKENKMKTITIKIFIAAVIIAAIILTPTMANAACWIYEDRDYGGEVHTLLNGDRMIMTEPPEVVSSSAHDSERVIYDDWWNDTVSSFKVSRGCTLTLWEDINQEGARFRSSRSFLYVGDRWNDEASEALCTCR
jgi:syncollin